MKKILFVLMATALMFIGVDSAKAMTPTYPNHVRFTRGVTNTCYYISPTASAYTSIINTAASQWAGMNNNIVNIPVSSSYATHIDFYSANPNTDANLDSGTYGYTTIWANGGTRLYFHGGVNYFYAEIVLNNSLSISSDTVAHEMGHAYGLAHATNRSSIMYTPKSGRLVTTPQSVDNDTINFLYP